LTRREVPADPDVRVSDMDARLHQLLGNLSQAARRVGKYDFEDFYREQLTLPKAGLYTSGSIT